MTPRTKFSLLVVSVAAISGLLWMRALASWRPVRLGQVTHDVIFLSADGKTCLTSRGARRSWRPSEREAFLYSTDISSGKSILWPVDQSYYFAFSSSVPELAAIVESIADPKELQIREVHSGRLKRTFHWPGKKWFIPTIVLSPDQKTVSIVHGLSFFQWNIESGQLTHTVKLDDKAMSTDTMDDYALSPDGTQIIGCKPGYGRVWNTKSGHVIRSWRIPTDPYSAPTFFSPDARVVIYSSTSSRTNSQGVKNPTAPYTFVDTTTGKVLWDTGRESVALSKESFYSNEVFMRSETGCEVLDIPTGRLKRRFAIPPRAGEILRVTHDYIYTRSLKGEIFRWRAR